MLGRAPSTRSVASVCGSYAYGTRREGEPPRSPQIKESSRGRGVVSYSPTVAFPSSQARDVTGSAWAHQQREQLGWRGTIGWPVAWLKGVNASCRESKSGASLDAL